MTYRPALLGARRLGERGWTAHAYARRGVTNRVLAEQFAQIGISPMTAEPLARAQMTVTDAHRLAELLSGSGIRALLAEDDRLMPSMDMPRLANMAERSVSRMRAWVHRTGVAIRYADPMDHWGVRPSSVAAWVEADRLRRPTDPYPLLQNAGVALQVPSEHLDGWLRFAVEHNVVYHPQGQHDRFTFLGGDTALFARAGLSPQEAAAMVAAGPVDREALTAMAGLRA